MPAAPLMIAGRPRARSPRSRARLEFIETAGNFGRHLGLPRSTGQIFGLLFFSAKAQSLDEIAAQLGISKASASTGTRQLAAWGAIRQVWVPGDRRDHFEVVPDLADLARTLYRDFIKPRLAVAQKRFDILLAQLDQDLTEGTLTRDEFDLCTGRLKSMHRLQKRVQSAAPLLERLL